MSTDRERYQQVKDKLDSVGPGFCLAKWNQVTMHLGTGLNHSCHHPAPHKIPLLEVLKNETALHNTRFKKRVRKQMLDGIRPKECDYCWRVEDTSDQYSDRVFKSGEPWALPTLEQIVQDPDSWSEDWFPRYVEISFSNRCNQACIYCGPNFSSRWQTEIKKYGSYKLTGIDYNRPISQEVEEQQEDLSQNEYVKAFWRWWPEMFKKLHTFRITGGEPTLVPEVFKILEYIQEHWEENPNIGLAINTNLNLPEEQLDRLLELLSDLSNGGKVRELIVYTSIEALGPKAEYIRWGMDERRFWTNVEKVLQRLPKTTLTLMATYNLLSVDSYLDLVEKVYVLKKKYHHIDRIYSTAVMLDTSYLRWPEFLSVKLCNETYIGKIKEVVDRVTELAVQKLPEALPPRYCDFTPGFCELEIEKIKRIYDYVLAKDNFDVKAKAQQLKEFIREIENRRGIRFEDVFGDLSKMIF